MDRKTAYSQNFSNIREQIKEAALHSGRDPMSIRLLAASKRTDIDGIALAYALGHRLFGENRAQSLRDKYDALVDRCPEAEWHFIGHLQKNKIKYIVGRATMIHSIDSLELASAVSEKMVAKCPGKTMNVLVQVKLGSDPNKTGCLKPQALELCRSIQHLPQLNLSGLMLIPPNDSNPSQWFEELYSLAEDGRKEGLSLDILSMGMSSDLKEAVAAGTTMVRIGTALFKEQH